MTKFKTCVEVPLSCTVLEKELPSISLLTNKSCTDGEEIIFDIYSILENFNSEINVEELINNNIEYNTINGKVVIKEAIKKHAELISQSVQDIIDLKNGQNGNFDITDWNLDGKCVFDITDEPTNIKQLFVKLIDKICELEVRITNLENI